MDTEEVRRKLQACRGRRGVLNQISFDTKIPYGWLCKFASGEIRQPGAHRIDELRKHSEIAGG